MMLSNVSRNAAYVPIFPSLSYATRKKNKPVVHLYQTKISPSCTRSRIAEQKDKFRKISNRTMSVVVDSHTSGVRVRGSSFKKQNIEKLKALSLIRGCMSWRRRRRRMRHWFLNLASTDPEAIAESRRQPSPMALVLLGRLLGGTGHLLLLVGLSETSQSGESLLHGGITHAADVGQVAGETTVMGCLRPLVLSWVGGSLLWRNLLWRRCFAFFLVLLGLGVWFRSRVKIDATVTARQS